MMTPEALYPNGVKQTLQALRELPLDVIIPARLVVSHDSGQAMLERVTKPRRPTKAMRELFDK